jgi:pimeloyl-ACP methyl ester carboxylesterase
MPGARRSPRGGEPEMPERTTVTARPDLEVEVHRRGTGPDLLYLHGLVGLLPQEPVLDALTEHFTVHAPVWPGYGPLENEGSLHDMLDFALLGWDIADAAGLDRPHLVGHSFGGMIAAEMACLARRDLDRLVLLAPYGLWRDDLPLPDPFAVLPFELVSLLLADQSRAAALAPPGLDLSSDEGLAAFMVDNSRRLGTAGKVLFPIPNRRLSRRLYRLRAPTLIVWGDEDALLPVAYADTWAEAVTGAETVTIPGAGHLLGVDAAEATAAAVIGFLTR